jgi:hypothetical protein
VLSGSQLTIDFRSIFLSLSRKLFLAKTIYGDIGAMLGPEAVGYATMTRWLREIAFVSVAEKPLNPP